MMRTIERKYLVPFALVTSMFLLWGLANNMTDTLLAAFKRIMSMSDTQTSFIQFAFYGSYFCFALPAALFIRRKSFKAGIILGLSLYALGAIFFIPAAYSASYGFYLVAIYIMAGGCSVLETSANPYILSMGSPETATRRLNIAQSFNPVGSIIGIMMSKYFILDDISLYSISGTYAALGLILIGILVVMLFAKMPTGRDNGQQDGVRESFGRLLANRIYRRGVIAQFFYVGAQIGVWSFTIRLVMQETDWTEAEASTVYLVSIIGHCLSRFVYTWLMKWIAPARLLIVGGLLSTVSTLYVVIGCGSGNFLLLAIIFVSTFMSLMFPTIYGLALGDIAKGEHPNDSKIGASGLIMAILGGAVLTPMQGYISDNFGVYSSYLLPTFCFMVVTAYAAYVTRHFAKSKV
ncbi:sugar MFS transporter [Prevotella pectinovora]|uniref:sugar MFS transporter n=1 Tax=Prevotella pectinovora TaxID=1602169 RepID=UPI003A92E45D